MQQPEMREATYPLSNGSALIRWPAEMSREDFEELEAWLRLVVSAAGRRFRSGGQAEGPRLAPE